MLVLNWHSQKKLWLFHEEDVLLIFWRRQVWQIATHW